jgi:hypothetical protein
MALRTCYATLVLPGSNSPLNRRGGKKAGLKTQGVTRNASHVPQSYLTPTSFSVNCLFFMASTPQFVPADVLSDFDFPQREAAFFYGLFLRGHSAEQLRRDIEVPSAVLAKWHREAERDPTLRDIFSRMVEYRRHVLAIFDTLVGHDGQPQRLQ